MLCIVSFSLLSCSDDDISEGQDDATNSENTEIPDDSGDPADDELNGNSQDLTFENSIFIVFSNGGVTIDNPFSDVAVESNSEHVVIRSGITDKEVNYILSGNTENGSVKIYGEYKFGLVLNGVGITNPSGAAINIQCGKNVSVTVVEQTNNRLIDGEAYVYTDGEDMKGTFFSEGQLNFYGNGNLEVRGKNKHAICTDDYFRMHEGNIWIKEASSDAIHANDYIAIEGGIIKTRSEGDALDCEKGYVEINGGEVEIVTTGSKAHGIKSSDYVHVNSTGTIDITVYGNGSKGFKPKGDMTITQGNITINSAGDAFWEAEENDITSNAGIKCDGNLLIENGSLTILSTGKGGKGINVDGTLTVNDGTIKVTTTGDQFIYDRDNDTAAKAIKSDGDLTINGGTITIRTSKTEAEGLESKATLTISGGEIDIEAYDDCINASTHIQIDGGYIYCNTETNDAIDSNGTLTITGGTIVVAGAGSPEGGIDCDQSRFSITGGTIIGVGGDTSSPTVNACTQYSVIFRSTESKIETIHIESTAGNKDVLTFKMPKIYTQSVTLLFSSPLLEKDTEYTIYTGGSISEGESFHGLYTNASYAKGSSAGSFTTNSFVSTVGTSTGGPGGGPGGPGWH